MVFKFCPLCASPMEAFTEDGFPCEKCATCGWVHYHNSRTTVSALLFSGRKILLCLRANEPFKGKWDIPGGYIEEKETPEDALRREMKEELGIEIEKENLLAVIGPTYYPFGGHELYNTDIYYVVTTSGEPRAVSTSDVAVIDWFDLDNLPDMAFQSNVRAIGEWRKLQK